jgi:hypothetical protein
MSPIACPAATGNAQQEDTVDHPQDPLDPPEAAVGSAR